MHKYLNLILIFILIGIVICVLILGAVPPVSRDALTHHLAIPKLYLLNGGMYEIPNLKFSYFAMNVDLLYIVPLYFNLDFLAKYIHFSFALGTSYLIYKYLKNRTNSFCGLFGSLFFLSTPIITKLSITAYVDLGLIFFLTIALLLLIKWKDSQKTSYFFYSSIFCGLALGTKPNGSLAFLLILFIIPFLIPNATSNFSRYISIQFSTIKYILLYLLISLIVFSPWAIRNYSWTSNPFFPFLNSVFSEAVNEKASLFLGNTSPLYIRKIVYNESVLDIILLPLRVFFQGKDNVPQFFDGKLNPFLLILPFFSFLNFIPNNKVRLDRFIFSFFSFLYIIFALLLTVARTRYLVPSIPFLVILSCFGLYNIFYLASKYNINSFIRNLILTVVFTFILSFNFSYIIQQFKYVNPLPFLTGTVNKNQYISNYIKEHSVVEYSNNYVSKNSKIACFFMGYRGYYIERNHLFFEPKKGSIPDIFTKLSQNTFSRPDYILANIELFSNWFESLDEKQKILIFPNRNIDLIYSSNGYFLLNIN